MKSNVAYAVTNISEFIEKNKKDWNVGMRFIHSDKYESGEDTFIYTIESFRDDCVNFICARDVDDSCGILFEPDDIEVYTDALHTKHLENQIKKKTDEIGMLVYELSLIKKRL